MVGFISNLMGKNLKDLANLLSIPKCKDIIFGVIRCFYPFF